MNVDDYFAIQNLLFSYPMLLDKGDFEGVGALFQHARVISGGAVMADRSAEAMTNAFKNWVITYADGTPRTRHLISNVQITPLSEHRAQISSYVMVFQQTNSFPLQPVIGGDYKDTVEKVDGQWRFVERVMGNDLIGDLRAHGRDLNTIKPGRAH